MKLIGIDLYQHLLERAVREARGETLERWTPVINLGIGGRIPPDWIPEADTRLSLYLRLARLTTREELDAFEDELIDRFGEEPDEAATLLRIANVRTMARNADIAKVDGGPSAIAFTQRSEKTKKAVAEAGLVAKNERLLLQASIPEPVGRLAATEKVLKQLGGAKKRA
jgi:transcription-repair coupling factor (superfamily II helicase)